MATLCLRCQSNPAIIHPAYGATLCASCRDSQQDNSLPAVILPEFAGGFVTQERKMFNRDIIQKYRGDELSSEWVQSYPDKAREQHTKEELKKAHPVWKGDLK